MSIFREGNCSAAVYSIPFIEMGRFLEILNLVDVVCSVRLYRETVFYYLSRRRDRGSSLLLDGRSHCGRYLEVK